MSTFVLVHGGGHGGWCYAKVKRRLEALGHEVFAPSLTGLAERSGALSPSIDLDTHIEDVVSLLHYWDLRETIVVGHSYGGMVITGVGDRAPDRVGKLVYLDAANPTNGQSLVDVTDGAIAFTRESGAVVDGVELVLLPAPGAAAFFGVEDPEDQVWMDARLTAHPWRCFEQPLELADETALTSIPQYHIICESTLVGRSPKLMATAREAGRLWQIDTGHDLMVTEPDFVTAALVEIADQERHRGLVPDPPAARPPRGMDADRDASSANRYRAQQRDPNPWMLASELISSTRRSGIVYQVSRSR